MNKTQGLEQRVKTNESKGGNFTSNGRAHILVCTGPGGSCDEHGQLSSPLIARNRAGQRSSVLRSGGGMSSGLAMLCSWLVIATACEARAKAATTPRVTLGASRLGVLRTAKSATLAVPHRRSATLY